MTFNKLFFFILNTLLNDIQQPVYFFIILLCVLGVVLQTILDIYMYVSLPVCMLWHVSMRIFNLFTIPLRKIRLREFVTDINNQLAWKYIKKPAIRSSALT
jgi:hypothetical protein